jgi:hypothetical protein
MESLERFLISGQVVNCIMVRSAGQRTFCHGRTVIFILVSGEDIIYILIFWSLRSSYYTLVSKEEADIFWSLRSSVIFVSLETS